MPTQDQFRQLAVDYAERLREYTRPLGDQIRQLRAQLSTVEGAFAAVRLAVHRQYTYDPGRELDWNCPHCWLQSKVQTRLTRTWVGHMEMWRCDVCGDIAQTPAPTTKVAEPAE